jgi:hypothetical protein
MDLKGYVTVRQLANSAIEQMGKKGEMSMYFKMVRYIIRGYKQLNQFSLNMPKVAKLYMNNINCIDIPEDYMGFVSLGVPYKGRVWTFTRDDKLINPDGFVCGEDTLDGETGETTVIGNTTIAGYGVVGGGNDYYYKIDLPNHRIIINGFPRTTVTLNYISTGISMSSETWIPRIAEEALIAWCQWQRIVYDDTVSGNIKAQYKQEYIEKENEIKFSEMPTLDEFYDAIYSTFMQGLKR